MNQAVPSSAAPPQKPARVPLPTSGVEGRDREFLPAALEILETPPSPMPVAFMLTICAFVAAALVWSWFGRLDVHAVAWGKIEANGRAKVIQPLDPGKVVALDAANGQHVKAGEALVELDSAEAQADVTAAAESLAASRAEIARRRMAIDTARPLQKSGADAAPPEVAPEIAYDSSMPPNIRARENSVLLADLAQLRDTLRNLDKQMEQKAATRQRLEASIAYQNQLMRTLNGRVEMREKSIKLEVGTKVNLFDAQESLQKSQSQLASDNGQLNETDKAMEEIASQKVKAIAQFIADNESKLADAARKADETAQQLAKAQAKLSHMIMRSPVDGIVQRVAVTTIGQVVTTGQQLMMIVPSGGPMEVEAYVSNVDIGFVKVGQPVEIKIDAFPFTRFGTLRGVVAKVATDSIDEQEAKRAESNAIAQANGASMPAQATPTGQQQSFVFPVTVSLEKTVMNVDGATVPLTPGMTVSAEIKTDSRRVIDYLLSPLSRVMSEAMRER
ncbi:MAG: HlyD family type I secretion periplasmic adaptor subunit [Hyphomicrobiales bacterium]|nr:HlyD family type I secretion periplasmic adaptor subunit [Hyphomicrobiales bacterium]